MLTVVSTQEIKAWQHLFTSASPTCEDKHALCDFLHLAIFVLFSAINFNTFEEIKLASQTLMLCHMVISRAASSGPFGFITHVCRLPLGFMDDS